MVKKIYCITACSSFIQMIRYCIRKDEELKPKIRENYNGENQVHNSS